MKVRIAADVTGRRRGIIAALTGVVAFAATLVYFYNAPVFDDAFISATFARNFSQGRGLTWTPGEPSFYGPTSLPFTLLLALGEWLGIGSLTTARWLGAFGWGVVHVSMFLVGVTFLAEPVAVIATLWSALLLVGPRWSVGMETGLYVAAIMAALSALQRRAYRGAFAFAAAAALIRPDGLILLGVVVVAAAITVPALGWRERLKAVTQAAAPAFAGAAVAGLLIVIFLGTLVPSSITAKRAFSCDVAGCISPQGLYNELAGHIGLGTATFLAVFAAVGAVRVLAARAWGAWPLLVFVVAYLATFTLARAPGSVWYYAPLAPALILFIAFGIAGPWPFRTRLLRRIGVAALTTAALLTTQSVFAVQRVRPANGVEPARAEVADSILRDMSVRQRSTASVLSFEVGYLGYTIPGRIIDLLGVVTPGLQPCFSREDGSDELDRLSPDYVVVIDQPYVGTRCIAGARALRADYVLLARVGRDFGYYMDNYLVYRRR